MELHRAKEFPPFKGEESCGGYEVLVAGGGVRVSVTCLVSLLEAWLFAVGCFS